MVKTQILVLGCNGQLGHALVKQLGEEAIPKPREVLDITNLNKIKEILPHVRPNLVINAAAITSPTGCERSPYKAWQTNVEAVDNLVKTCAIYGIPLIHISCDQVFGAQLGRKAPYTETDAIGPLNTYGNTKAAAEHSILRLGQCICPEYWKAGFRYWIVRTSMLYEHPWRQAANWIYGMSQFASYRRDSELALPTDLIRAPTYAPHLAKAVIWIAKHHREIVSGVYHITNSGQASLFEIGSFLSTCSKVPLKVTLTSRESYARTHGRNVSHLPQYLSLDCSKFHEISSISMPTWQEGIEEFSLTTET